MTEAVFSQIIYLIFFWLSAVGVDIETHVIQDAWWFPSDMVVITATYRGEEFRCGPVTSEIACVEDLITWAYEVEFGRQPPVVSDP